MKEVKEILAEAGITIGMFNRYKAMGLVSKYSKKASTPGKSGGGFRYFYDDGVIGQIREVQDKCANGISLMQQQKQKWVREQPRVVKHGKQEFVILNKEGEDPVADKMIESYKESDEKAKMSVEEVAEILSKAAEEDKELILSVLSKVGKKINAGKIVSTNEAKKSI